MNILLLRTTPETEAHLCKHTSSKEEIYFKPEWETPGLRNIRPIPTEKLISMRLFRNNNIVETAYEKFIGRKIKTA